MGGIFSYNKRESIEQLYEQQRANRLLAVDMHFKRFISVKLKQ